MKCRLTMRALTSSLASTYCVTRMHPKPEGRLILNLPAFEALKGRHDIAVHAARRYTEERVRTLLASVNLITKTGFYWDALLFLPFIAWRQLTRFVRSPDETGTKGDLSPMASVNQCHARHGRKTRIRSLPGAAPAFRHFVYAVAKNPRILRRRPADVSARN